MSGWSKEDDLKIYVIHVLENSSPMFKKFKQTIGKNPFNANGLCRIFDGKSPYEIDQRAREIGCDLVWGPNDDAIICDWDDYPDTSSIKDLLSAKRTDVQIIARKEFLEYYYSLKRKKNQPLDYKKELNDYIKNQRLIEKHEPSIYSTIFKEQEDVIQPKKKVTYRKKNIEKPKQQRKALWTAEEDRILKIYYPTEGCLCATRLKGRSQKSVASRAGVLRLKMNKTARLLNKHLRPLKTDMKLLSIHRSNDTILRPITISSYNKVLYTGKSSGKTMLINNHRYYMTYFYRKDMSMQIYLIYDITQNKDINIPLSYKTEEDFYKDFTVLTI